MEWYRLPARLERRNDTTLRAHLLGCRCMGCANIRPALSKSLAERKSSGILEVRGRQILRSGSGEDLPWGGSIRTPGPDINKCLLSGGTYILIPLHDRAFKDHINFVARLPVVFLPYREAVVLKGGVSMKICMEYNIFGFGKRSNIFLLVL